MMGNRFLLDDPQIISVRARRAFTDGELQRAKASWTATTDNGCVIAGAFITPPPMKKKRLIKQSTKAAE